MDLTSVAVERTLMSKPMLLAHPSSSALSDLYANTSNASSHLVETINRNGALRVTGSSLRLGSTTNFSISSSLLVYAPTLNLELLVPAAHIVDSGWGLQAINSIEVSIANSLLQNWTLSGTALRDIILYNQFDPEKRSKVLIQCGEPTVDAIATASIPLASLLNRTNISNTFPVDFSTMNGFLQVNITFNSAEKFMVVSSANPATAFPTSFNKCELTFCSTAIADAGFAIKNALAQDPMAVYGIPSQWFSNYKYNKSVVIDNETAIELITTSTPKGLLQGALISVQPTAELQGASNGRTELFPSPLEFSDLRVSYNGIDIFRADSKKELNAYLMYRHDGDDLSYEYRHYRARNVAQICKYHAKVYFIPFNYHSGMCRTHHLENLPSYDGASLQWQFTIDPSSRVYNTEAAILTDVVQDVVNTDAAQDVTIEITWVLSALLEINQSGVDLQR